MRIVVLIFVLVIGVLEVDCGHDERCHVGRCVVLRGQ